jgi:amino acid transporter
MSTLTASYLALVVAIIFIGASVLLAVLGVRRLRQSQRMPGILAIGASLIIGLPACCVALATLQLILIGARGR